MITSPSLKFRPLGNRAVRHARALLAVSALAALAVPSRALAQTPTFNTVVTTSTGGPSYEHPNLAGVGDFNGDGKLDALISTGSANLRLMLGNGNGTFSLLYVSTPGAGNQYAVRVADLNGDGRLDAITASNQGNLAAAVLINTGNLAGVPQFTVTNYVNPGFGTSGLRSLTIGDLNADGKPDFVVGNANGGLRVWLNNGDGTFTGGQYYGLQPGAGGSVGGGVIADFNNDGKADFLVTSNQNHAINVFFGNGDGTFQATPGIIPSTDGMWPVVSDLNHDGKPDFLVIDVNGATSGKLLVYLNNGNGTFSGPTAYATGLANWGPLAIADINGDGKIDAVVSDFYNGSGVNNVAVLLGNGDATFGAGNLYNSTQRAMDLSVGDFNGDGKPDIATVGYNDNTYGVLLNTTVFAPPLPTQTLTILGGSGSAGGVAANVEYKNPATGNWQPAYLTGWHPWGFVTGTNSWINYKMNTASDPGAGANGTNSTYWYLYRVRFTVPADAVEPKMTFSLKADNFAQVAINGVTAGGSTQYINYANINNVVVGSADQVNVDAVFSQNVHPGENTITLNIGDWGGLNGFNFRIDLSMKSSQPLEIVPVKTDTTAPVIASPGNLIREATSAAGAVVNFTATAVDNVDGPVNVVASPASGSTFVIGTTPVGLAAADAAGNTATASFTVTVRDTTPPVVTVPGNITAEATSASGAAVAYAAPTATDAVGVTSLTSSPASGSTFGLGSTTVTATAKDAAGNTGTGSFTVSVVDTIAPALTVPASQTLEATSAAGAVATFAASATDAVGPVTITYSAASGSTFAIGTTSVTVTAKDAYNNTSTGSFTITVKDTTAPALTVPASQTLEATSAAGAAATFAASATDAVGPVTITYSAASGSTFAIGTTSVTVTAKDAYNNTSTGSFTITVRDTTAPVIASLTPSTATLWPPNHQMVAVKLTVAASDAVGYTLRVTSVTSSEPDNGLGDGDTPNDIQFSGAAGDLTVNLRAERSGKGNGRTYTITVEAKDAAGNATTKTCTVSVPKSQGGK